MNNCFSLSKQNTLFLKGISILCIMAHNFFHFIPPVTSQNELFFNADIALNFLFTFTLGDALNSIFSLFGFYWTFLFVFLSGYGLVKSYKKNKGNFISFTLPRIAKIYMIFIISALFCVFYFLGQINYLNVLKVLSLTSNFSEKNLFLICGPWWFFSLIIQLYIIFIPLTKFIKKNIWNILYIFIIAFSVAAYFLYIHKNTTLFYANFLGHLPEFSFGIFLATYEKKLPILGNRKFNCIVFLLAISIVILAQFYSFFFIFSFLSSVILNLSFFQIVGYRNNRFLLFTGSISPFLFGLHGFLLRRTFVELARNTVHTHRDFLYCLIWIIMNYIFAYLFYRLFQKLKTDKILH